jgi:hypothetical protein
MVLGASYGALFGTRLLAAGYEVDFVCREEEARFLREEGTLVTLPVRGHPHPVTLRSATLPGVLSASSPDAAFPDDCALVVFAMQEPQLAAPEIAALLRRIAEARRPCLSIMNMPPLPYLRRLSGIDTTSLLDCYTDASVWNAFDPDWFTHASADPQAARPAGQPPNVLRVGLPTNFKVAPFAEDGPTTLLHELQRATDATRIDLDGESVALPVRIRLCGSIHAPLAKWSMLLTGNYRCVLPDGARSIRTAVTDDPTRSREVYEWVGELCLALGASEDDLVPFERYEAASRLLLAPSSVARAIEGGAKEVERVDLLLQHLGRSHGMIHPEVDRIVETIDARLARNRGY